MNQMPMMVSGGVGFVILSGPVSRLFTDPWVTTVILVELSPVHSWQFDEKFRIHFVSSRGNLSFLDGSQ